MKYEFIGEHYICRTKHERENYIEYLKIKKRKIRIKTTKTCSHIKNI